MTARRRIQRFELVDQLGSGAMGTVYRARDPQLERDVAIKVLAQPTSVARAELTDHDTVDLRGTEPAGELLSEARMMARLSHPNVLPVYEVGLADGEVFVVMELIPGADLRTWLTTPRSRSEILDVFAQAGRGLAAAHAQGIVHRDFKPENVLVGDDGRVRVADFGLSQLTAHRARLRVEDAVGGTPHYMAPELWQEARATEQSDIFAFCTALADAMPDLDAKLRVLVTAGRADDPAARPTLAALIAACVPRRRFRPWWLVVPVVAAIGGVAVALTARTTEPCVADDVRLAGDWSGPRHAQLATLGVAPAFDAERHTLDTMLHEVCAAERSSELTRAQARERTSCLERRGFELDALAAKLVADHADARVAHNDVEALPQLECRSIAAPPLPEDRTAIVALYRTLAAANAMPTGSPERTRSLATLETTARGLGDLQLETRAALSLGMRQIETDDLSAADASLGRAYDRAVAIHASSTALIALVERAIAAARRGDASAAKSYGKLAVELADKPGASARDRTTVYYGLATADLAHGDTREAIEMLRKALAVIADDGHRQRLRELDVRIALIGALEQLGGHEAEALTLATETVGLARTTLGDHDLDYGTALNVLAIALRHTGDAASALRYRREALAVMQANLPADHSAIVGQRANVSDDLYANGQFEDARAELAAVLATPTANEATRALHPLLTADLGALTFATGRTDEGLQLFEQGLDEMVSQQGQDHPSTLDYRLQRIELELEVGRDDDAEHHADALEHSYRARSDQALGLAKLGGIVRAQLALVHHRPHDAEALARDALSAWAELHGDDANREEILRTLAASLIDQRRFDAATAPLDEATALARANHELADRVAQLDVERARVLAGRGQATAARALAKTARDVLDRFPGDLRARAAAAALAR